MTNKEIEQPNYTDEQVEIFVDLDTRSNKFYSKIKNRSIVIFVATLFVTQLYIEADLGYIKQCINYVFERVTINNLNDFEFSVEKRLYIGLVIMGVIVLYPLLVWWSKNLLYRRIRKTSKKINLIKPRVRMYFMSPDGFFSKYYKDELEKDLYEKMIFLENYKDYYTKEVKERVSGEAKNFKYGLSLEAWNLVKIERKFFIEWSNWLNCIFSILLCTATFLWIYFVSASVYSIIFFFSLLVYRLFSRGIEIALSFYQDVVNKRAKIIYRKGKAYKYVLNFKSSLIRSRGRLSLAIHSLIELTFLYSSLYFINSILTDTFEKVVLTPFNSLLFSASLGVFNFSFNYADSYLLFPQSILHISQILLSVVLILLSIAQYVGANDDLSKIDEELYLKVELKKEQNRGNL